MLPLLLALPFLLPALALVTRLFARLFALLFLLVLLFLLALLFGLLSGLGLLFLCPSLFGFAFGLAAIVCRIVFAPVGVLTRVLWWPERGAGKFLEQCFQRGRSNVQQVSQKTQDIMVGKRQAAIVGGNGNGLVHHGKPMPGSTVAAQDFGSQLDGLHVALPGNEHERPEVVSVTEACRFLRQPPIALAVTDLVAVDEYPGLQQKRCRIHLAVAL